MIESPKPENFTLGLGLSIICYAILQPLDFYEFRC